jgi:S1-C subfamily serine protease
MPPELTPAHRRLAAFATVAVALTAALGGHAGASPGNVGTAIDPAVVDVDATLGYLNETGAGTGIVLTSSGEILTNNHVIRNATSISVTDVGNGRRYPATVVGYDVADDVAVLKLKGAAGLKTIPIGSSAGVTVGQAVTAIGNAGGVGSTPSQATGTVLALDKSVTAKNDDGTSEPLQNMIETNALTQAGDSGGPLVDTAGRVIGISTAAFGAYVLPSGKTGSVAFAIPITKALAAARLIEAGRTSATTHIGATALLGVVVEAAATNMSGEGRMYIRPEPLKGALVNQALQNSPAARAGLAAGDLITTFAGRRVSSPTTLTKALLRYSPKASVTVDWVDQSGTSHQASIQLGTGPAQ